MKFNFNYILRHPHLANVVAFTQIISLFVFVDVSGISNSENIEEVQQHVSSSLVEYTTVSGRGLFTGRNALRAFDSSKLRIHECKCYDSNVSNNSAKAKVPQIDLLLVLVIPFYSTRTPISLI